jgi:lipid-A-disaccharide synthase
VSARGTSLLVVAGEASGDRAAAAVVARLRTMRERAAEASGDARAARLRVFGLGGGALAREGVELLADLRDLTAMGFGDVARRAAHVALAYAKIRARITRDAPRAALLVDYTEFNTRLAPELWRRGCRVLWYGAPQIWAWRPTRGERLRRHVDRMAVVLPFEERLWRDKGADARFVGHPALEDKAHAFACGPTEARLAGRELLGMTRRAWAVAILPGSRPHEVRTLLGPMLAGYESVRREHASVDGRVLLAPSLDDATRVWARELAAIHRVDVVDVDARGGLAHALAAFDAALCASGTASLECALARAVPVVCYRVGWLTERVARASLAIEHVALPNILLGRRAFPELLQDDCNGPTIAEHLERVLLERDAFVTCCEEVEATLGEKTRASSEVARMLEPWLDASEAAGGVRRTDSGTRCLR